MSCIRSNYNNPRFTAVMALASLFIMVTLSCSANGFCSLWMELMVVH